MHRWQPQYRRKFDEPHVGRQLQTIDVTQFDQYDASQCVRKHHYCHSPYHNTTDHCWCKQDRHLNDVIIILNNTYRVAVNDDRHIQSAHRRVANNAEYYDREVRVDSNMTSYHPCLWWLIWCSLRVFVWADTLVHSSSSCCSLLANRSSSSRSRRHTATHSVVTTLVSMQLIKNNHHNNQSTKLYYLLDDHDESHHWFEKWPVYIILVSGKLS